MNSATTTPAKKSVKKKAVKEDDMKYIYYFYRPQCVEKLWKFDLAEGDDEATVRKLAVQINASGHYSTVVTKDAVYSFGMGDNY